MKTIFCCLIILMVTACKEKYDAPVQSPPAGYLVIDGVVNSGPGPAAITLTRTTKFDNKDIVYENGASVKLEGSNNTVYTFSGQGNGRYAVDSMNLDVSASYRLHIVAGGKEYLSSFETIVYNPPIDSVSRKYNGGDLQLYINTHNSQNNTRYYQWRYDETWQIISPYLSYLKYKIETTNTGNYYSVVYRDSVSYSYNPNIVNCWQYFSSSAIILGSTAKLSEDVVNLPLAIVPHASAKLAVLYSINVQQFGWKKEGYEFLETMKKNTESTGSVFDAQPSELKGNIHCVSDVSDPVIGYFNLCAIRQTRIFVKPSEVPDWNYQSNCKAVEVENNSDSIFTKALGLMPTMPTKFSPFGGILLFQAAPASCVDCTLSGSNVKPSYWP